MTTTETPEVAIAPTPDPLKPLQSDVVGIHPALSPDDVLTIYDRIIAYLSALKAIKAQCEAAMIEHIKANGDLVVREGIRYYVGPNKKVKCRNRETAFNRLLEATGGDAKAFCEILASDAYKHGAAKKVLAPEAYDECFKTVIEDDLKEGVAKPTLKKFDESFVR